MATTNFLQLPAVIGLTGNEFFPLDVPNGDGTYTTKKSTVSLAVGFTAGTTPQAANSFYVGPTTAPAAPPAFRLMVPADLPAAASSFFWNNASGFLGLGTTAPTTNLTISQNAAALPSVASAAQTLLHLGAADGSNTRLLIDSFGTSVHAALTGRRSRGTAASPSAVTTDDPLLQVSARGYGQTAYASAARAAVTLLAGEAWSDTAQGTYISFSTTTNTTTTTAERMRLTGAGNLGLGVTGPVAGIVSKLGTISTLPNQTPSAQFGVVASNSMLEVGVANVSAFGNRGYIQGGSFLDNSLLELYVQPFGANTLINTSAGNTLIGTTTAVDKLTVGGGGIAISGGNLLVTGLNNAFATINKLGAGFEGTLNFALNGVGGPKVTWDTGGNFGMAGPNSVTTYVQAGNGGILQLATGGGGNLSFSPGGEIARMYSTGMAFASIAPAATYATGTVQPILQVPTPGSNASIATARFSADANGSTLFLTKSRGAAVGTMTIVQSGDTVGTIRFEGADGSNFTAAAAISAAIDATPGATTDMPGRLSFQTCLDGTSTLSERLRIDNVGRVAIGSGGTTTAWLGILQSGSNTTAPIQLTSGTNLTSALAGAIEYDGSAFYTTPVTSNRGVAETVHFLSLAANQTGTNVNTAQPWFPGGGATTITLPATTMYWIEGHLSLSRSAGTTSHTIALLFGGSATITSINYVVMVTDQNSASSSLSAPQVIEGAVATSVVITAASANATQANTIYIWGNVRINGAGTFIPQFIYSAAPGGAPTILANSYFRMKPMGAGGVLSVGNWS